jgi:folate-binding protein YgfZ
MDAHAIAASVPASAASVSAAPDNRWQAPAADLQRALVGPVWAQLDDLSVIAVDGADATAFLHAQTTADIAALQADTIALAGYCTPKGRLQAIFQVWRTRSGLRMLLPRAIAEATRRRLSMFVLRSKVQLVDVSPSWSAIGICGPGSMAALVDAGLLGAPIDVGQARSTEGEGLIARLPAGASSVERLMLVVATPALADWRRRLATLSAVDAGVWWWSQIDAAVPAVFESTRELFVPQAVNLELLGAVSFRKGCYPGQEIVARSQYLGKLRRRMALAHAPHIGGDGDVYHADESGPVGRIVIAAAAPGGGWDMLIECPSELAGRGSLHAGAPNAPALALRELPYPIFDPTA